MKKSLVIACAVCSALSAFPTPAMAVIMKDDAPVATEEASPQDQKEVDFEKHNYTNNFYPYYIKPNEKGYLYLSFYKDMFSNPDDLPSFDYTGYTYVYTVPLKDLKLTGDILTSFEDDSVKIEKTSDKVTVTLEKINEFRDKNEIYTIAIPLTVSGTTGAAEIDVSGVCQGKATTSTSTFPIKLEITNDEHEDLVSPYKGDTDPRRSSWMVAYGLGVGLPMGLITEEDYTPETVAAITEAGLKVGKVIDDPEATLDDFGKAIKDFQAFVKTFQPVELEPTAEEKKALQKVQDEAKNLKEKDWTADAWNKFQKENDEVTKGLKRPGAGKRTTKAATEKLRNALDELYTHPSDGTTDPGTDEPTTPGNSDNPTKPNDPSTDNPNTNDPGTDPGTKPDVDPGTDNPSGDNTTPPTGDDPATDPGNDKDPNQGDDTDLDVTPNGGTSTDDKNTSSTDDDKQDDNTSTDTQTNNQTQTPNNSQSTSQGQSSTTTTQSTTTNSNPVTSKVASKMPDTGGVSGVAASLATSLAAGAALVIKKRKH